uniref:Uncharacterized protein n=1 Tax=Anguilla anguilla TaxID=7936 RepID=A0A0E9WD79_ANGAN
MTKNEEKFLRLIRRMIQSDPSLFTGEFVASGPAMLPTEISEGAKLVTNVFVYFWDQAVPWDKKL